MTSKRVLWYIILLWSVINSCDLRSDGIPSHSTKIYSGKYYTLAIAIFDQNLQQIDEIVKVNHLALNHTDSTYHISLLNWCIFNKKEKSYRKLLELGADPDWADTLWDQPPSIIYAACKTGSFLSDALLFGGNPNAFFSKGQWFAYSTSLGGAVYSGSLDNVQMLVRKGANINFTPCSYCNPLINAMTQNEIFIAKYLLLNGANAKTFELNENRDTIGVLFLMRNMTFPLKSREHEVKMQVVDILKAKGLNYWDYPIPEMVKKSFDDPEYLLKY